MARTPFCDQNSSPQRRCRRPIDRAARNRVPSGSYMSRVSVFLQLARHSKNTRRNDSVCLPSIFAKLHCSRIAIFRAIGQYAFPGTSRDSVMSECQLLFQGHASSRGRSIGLVSQLPGLCSPSVYSPSGPSSKVFGAMGELAEGILPNRGDSGYSKALPIASRRGYQFSNPSLTTIAASRKAETNGEPKSRCLPS